MNTIIEDGPLNSREIMLDKVERITEIPLMILSLIMIPLLLGPFLWEMSGTEKTLYFVIDVLIWILFVTDMVIKTTLSTNRLNYLRTHWFDLIIIALPWFRPLRSIRLIMFATKSYRGITRTGKPDFLLVYAIALLMICATIVTTFERGHDSSLESFPQSLWWSLVTVITIGYSYGDTVPASTAGRVVAVFLMFGGLGIFGAITANLAAAFSNAEDPNTKIITELAQQVKELQETMVPNKN